MPAQARGSAGHCEELFDCAVRGFTRCQLRLFIHLPTYWFSETCDQQREHETRNAEEVKRPAPAPVLGDVPAEIQAHTVTNRHPTIGYGQDRGPPGWGEIVTENGLPGWCAG